MHTKEKPYAAVNGHFELTLLKGPQRFDVVSASNLEVYKFSDWWMFTYFIFGPGESSPNNIWSKVNLDPIILEKRWIDGESWPNDFVEKVNRGEDLRWVGSRYPLTRALTKWPIRLPLIYFRGTRWQSSLSRRLLAFYIWMNRVTECVNKLVRSTTV